MAPSDSSANRLYVEGVDDQHTILHLMMRHGIDWDSGDDRLPVVKKTGSVGELLDILSVAPKSSGTEGFVLDADENLDRRWQAIRERLHKTDVQVGASPAPEGTIVDGISPRTKIGIWVMPDNNISGTLEDFLAYLVPDNDPTIEYADEVAELARQKGAPCPDNDHLKSKLHTWLAWQEAPGRPYGTAIKARFFDHDTDLALKFVDWFKRLYQL